MVSLAAPRIASRATPEANCSALSLEDSALVLRFLRAGKSDELIAEALDISLADLIAFYRQRILEPAPCNAHEDISPAERRVLELVVQGQSNKQAARLLGLSPNTVRHHVGQLMQKANMPNRTSLALWAKTKGY